LSSISTPLTNALNAIGKVKITLYLMVFWTIATWVLTPLAIFWFGFNGVAMASAAIATSVIGVIFFVKKHVAFNLTKVLTAPIIATGVMGLLIYFLSNILVSNLLGIFAMIGVGILVYFAMMFALGHKQLIADIKTVGASLKK
jgi:O-antigen/teichoic acid export membrane protein